MCSFFFLVFTSKKMSQEFSSRNEGVPKGRFVLHTHSSTNFYEPQKIQNFHNEGTIFYQLAFSTAPTLTICVVENFLESAGVALKIHVPLLKAILQYVLKAIFKKRLHPLTQ